MVALTAHIISSTSSICPNTCFQALIYKMGEIVHNLIRGRFYLDNTQNLLSMCVYNFYVMELCLGYLDCYCSAAKGFLSLLFAMTCSIYPSSALGLKLKAFENSLIAAQGFEGEVLIN